MHFAPLLVTFRQFIEDPQIGFGVAVRLHHLAHQIDAPLGVGEHAFFFAPQGGGQIHMRILRRFDIGVRILHHHEFEFLQRLADARRVGHGGQRIGGHQPQRLDLPGFDRRKNIGHEQATLLGEKLGIHTPELADGFAILFFFQRTIAGQAGARRPFARAHGIALSGDRQAGAAGLADVAGDQIQIVDRRHTIGAMRALIDAHGPDRHRGTRLGIKARDVAYGVFVDAADARGGDGIVLRHQRGEFFITTGVRIDVGAIRQIFFQDHMRQAVQQHQIRAGLHRQMDVSHLRKHGDARIDHDHRKLAFFQRHFQAPVNNRMLLRQVGTEGDQAFGAVEIVVAARRAIRAKRALVTGHG
jgi:hypothetical protein